MPRLLLFPMVLLGLSACQAKAEAADPGRAFASSADERSEREAVFNKVQAAIAEL